MACTLSKSQDPGVDFEGKTGDEFTVTILPADGSTLTFLGADYAGKSIVGSKAKFKVVAGDNALIVSYAAAQHDERGDLIELCSGGTTKQLRGIRSTENPNRQYVVRGK